MKGMTIACPRMPVARVVKVLPASFIQTLEQNQKIASCCRHPEDHDIEAFKSKAEEQEPDIYIFYCTCGRKHTRFMVGEKIFKPAW